MDTKKIKTYSEIKLAIEKEKRLGKKIIFTSGCFDILHLGHIAHFDFCKTKGDILVVNLGNDKTLAKLKGPTRPFNNQRTRALMLTALTNVDYVVISTEYGKMDHSELIKIILPHYYVVPLEDSHFEKKKELIERSGGKIIGCKRIPPKSVGWKISTTGLARKLRAE